MKTKTGKQFEMKKLFMSKGVAAAAGLIISGAASASPMYIDLTGIESVNGNVYDYTAGTHTADAGSQTGIFTEFGFSQFLATSVYDLSDGLITGSFYDTNDVATLTGLGIPTSGTALDGSTFVSLVLPNCPAGQCDIDALSPLVPPLSGDSEGFSFNWDLQVEYTLNGTLSDPGGPNYTSGTIDVYFNSFIDDADDQLAFSGTLTGSIIQAANLDLFFDVSYALPGFLWVQNGDSTFVDAGLNDLESGDLTPVTLALDTNVNPPIPTEDQLLMVGTNAIRQTTLDGSVTAQIPAPGTLVLLGLGLAGLGTRLRGRRRS